MSEKIPQDQNPYKDMPARSEANPNSETNKEDKERHAKFDDLMLVSSTLYKDLRDPVTNTRMEAALGSFQRAKNSQIRCAVLDGGSDQIFLDSLEKLGNVEVKVDPSLGIGASRREAFRMALNHQDVKFFLNIEPEKSEIISDASLEQIISILRANQADIVLANRRGLADKDSRVSQSMVKLQRWFELRANKRANKLLYGGQVPEHPLDIWFSVEMMNRQGAEYFVNYKSDLDKWDAMVKPILDAHNAGKRVTSVDVDFAYANTQTESEQSDRVLSKKRLTQYSKILEKIEDPFWKNRSEKK